MPFKQATSVKYELSEDLIGAELNKVVVDYNDIVYVLTDKGLYRDYYENEISKDLFYRLLATKFPVDITLQEETGYLYYLYEDEFLTNAHAGVIYITPVVGWIMPHTSWSNVDFPLPFLPTMPTVSPFFTSSETSMRALNG